MKSNHNNNNRRSRGRSNAISAVQQLRGDINGRSVRTKNDPPAVVDKPWNNVVVKLRIATSGSLTIADVHSAFLNQVFQLTEETVNNFPTVAYRLQEARAWELSGASLGLIINDLQTPVSVHRSQSDEPGRNHWSSVGLVWSKANQSVSLLSTEQTPVLSATSSSDTPQILFHLRLVWRAEDGVTPISVPRALVVRSWKTCPVNDGPSGEIGEDLP